MTFADFIIEIERATGRSLSQENRENIYEVAHLPYLLASAFVDFIESDVANRSLTDSQRRAVLGAWAEYMAS